MINAKGEWLYSCAEIGDALGIHPNTVRAAASRLYGRARVHNFTVTEAQHIQAYFTSIEPAQEALRIKTLFDALKVNYDNYETKGE